MVKKKSYRADVRRWGQTRAPRDYYVVFAFREWFRFLLLWWSQLTLCLSPQRFHLKLRRYFQRLHPPLHCLQLWP